MDVEAEVTKLFETTAQSLRDHETMTVGKATVHDIQDTVLAITGARRPHATKGEAPRGRRDGGAGRKPPHNKERDGRGAPGECWGCGNRGHFLSACPVANRNEARAARPSRTGEKAIIVAGDYGTDALATTTSAVGPTAHLWVWDTGADSHVCKDKQLMVNLRPATGLIKMAAGPPLQYHLRGDVPLTLHLDGGPLKTKLTDVIYLETGNYNRFSPRAACLRSGGVTSLDRKGISSVDGRQFARWLMENGRCYLDASNPLETVALAGQADPRTVEAPPAAQKSLTPALRISTRADWLLWHQRLGHASIARIKRSFEGQGVVIENTPKNIDCNTCHATKHARPSFGVGANVTSRCLDLVASDLMGPMDVPSLSGNRYCYAPGSENLW
jgi:hypothetical protein